MSVRAVACTTVIVLGGATAGAALMAATTVTTVATVAYAILAVGLAGLSIASVTAWIDSKSSSVESYFENMLDHSSIAIPAIVQLIAQALVQGLIQGLANGVTRLISDKVAGPTHHIQLVR